jgi:hypothetical protein
MELVDFVNLYTRADVAFGIVGRRGYASGLDFLTAWLAKLRAPDGAYRGGKQLIYGDALYLRAPEAYSAAALASGKDPRVQLSKAVAICAILGYGDCAAPYLRIGRERGFLSASDEQLLAAFVAATSRRLPAVLADVRRLAARLGHRFAHPRE